MNLNDFFFLFIIYIGMPTMINFKESQKIILHIRAKVPNQ